MRPPECAICDLRMDSNSDCELIYFARRPEDDAWHERMKQIDGVGHPPEAEWFCERHFPRAKELSRMTISEAMKILRQEFA